MQGIIFDIKKYAIHDGPGIRTTVFMKGCPLRCRWCHNPESWSSQPELMSRPNEGQVTVGRWVEVDEIMAGIIKDVVFYDESGGGVTFSGGEPLMQPEFLKTLLKQCRDQEIHCTLDTCLYAERSVLEEIAPLVDLFLCDVKHLDAGQHQAFTAVDNQRILENMRYLADAGCEMIVRVPVVPGFNDDVESIEAIASFSKSLKCVNQVDLLGYHSGGVSKGQRLKESVEILQCDRPDTEKMNELQNVVTQYGFHMKAGG